MNDFFENWSTEDQVGAVVGELEGALNYCDKTLDCLKGKTDNVVGRLEWVKKNVEILLTGIREYSN